jgi:hypothetical protein
MSTWPGLTSGRRRKTVGVTQTIHGWKWRLKRKLRTRFATRILSPAGKEDEEEEEEGSEVSMVRADEQEEERGGWWTPDHSWLEMEAEEEDEEEILYTNSIITEMGDKDKRAGDDGLSEGCAH